MHKPSQLRYFQTQAVSRLQEAAEGDRRDIVFKSCTGSGKTVMLSHFMDRYLQAHPRTVFVWLTPGKGNLEEQSKAKMDLYVPTRRTKLLQDVMVSGFAENDVCFVNWEKLTKKGNQALRESERRNFLDWVEQAHRQELRFLAVVDESHQNHTIKARDILDLFRPLHIIRSSATPLAAPGAALVEVPEWEVIQDGLIKKLLIINENFPRILVADNHTHYLLERALDKQRELRAAFTQRSEGVNPLIIVQLPNRSELLQDQVERWFAGQGISYENGRLAVWLADRKQNLEEIVRPDAQPVAVIIKQAVATGWDCPRAHILVKLRENMDETFEIQTIGRIRRMPRAHHYESDLLDSCYLYTLDEKFTQGVRQTMQKGALDAEILPLKKEAPKFALISEKRSGIPYPRNDGATVALQSLRRYFAETYGTGSSVVENRELLERRGYVFSREIITHTVTGATASLEQVDARHMDRVYVPQPLDTHRHGREYQHQLGKLALKLGLEYGQLNTVVRRLFDRAVKSKDRILSLETRELYAFVLNNARQLREDFLQAMAAMSDQLLIPAKGVVRETFRIPRSCVFTYDSTQPFQDVLEKNVYQGYRASAQPRSAPETVFERYCEERAPVEWVYRNGDKGQEYLSILYQDGFEKQRAFYPDYLVQVGGQLWIVEIKGGWLRSGQSADIDLFTPRKFEVLKQYLDRNGLRGGFVRKDEYSQRLCICTEAYSPDLNSANWRLLDEVWT